MNAIPEEAVMEIYDLVWEGIPAREIARRVKRSLGTVRRYRGELLDVLSPDGIEPKCGCGLAAGHAGWCHVRVSRSERRKAWLAKSAAEKMVHQFGRVKKELEQT